MKQHIIVISFDRLFSDLLAAIDRIISALESQTLYDDLNICEYPEQRARLEDESKRAQQREDQVTYSVRAKVTIKHHCKAHYSTNRKASHRARNTI